LKKTNVSEVRTSSIIALMMEAIRAPETSVYFDTRRRYIPEDCHLHMRRRENLKSHVALPLFVFLAGSKFVFIDLIKLNISAYALYLFP
jgi:hypothetical protein